MSDINPAIDVAFKKIFGVEENKDLLISLINSIVSKKDQVADVTLLNPYNPQNSVTDKLSILDIKAKGLDGTLFNIEVQITDHADYDKRALFYWAKLYTDQLKSGQSYSKLQKAIGIHILNFHSIPNSKKYHNIFHIVETESGEKYYEDLELHTIELTKFSKDIEDDRHKLVKRIKTALDCWSAFLTKHDLLEPENLPENLKKVPVKKAINVLDIMHMNDTERSQYEDHLKFIRDEASAISKAEEKGETRGIKIGREEGMEKGREEGIEQTAINMLKQNLDDSLISSVTGLSLDHILVLKNKL